MKSFSHKTRTENLERLKSGEEIFDLLIIGGGITGAGAARDAASRGMSVALVEARDFAEGTSSRSSKLIHGGIRYLENLEFGLVFEALSERERLFKIAPFLVHPLRFMLPVYEGNRVGMFQLGLGMWLYDALSLFDAPEMHEALSVKDCLEKAPFLDSKKLKGGYIYSDAYMDDDRLVLQTLRSAHEWGAVCVNHVKATGAKMKDGVVDTVECVDQLSPNQTASAKFSLKAKHVVSTVGPWTDEVATELLGEWKKILRPSKGIHITLQRNRLPLKDAVVMISDDEKRIVFAIPRHEMIIIGTTDTDYRDPIENVHSDAEDVRYLLQIANEYFPNAKLTVDDIMASYSGVRPLVHDGSSSESKTSREHIILNDPRGVTFVAGGKYTTYRRMAEQTVEACLKYFSSKDQMGFKDNRTLEPLNRLATQDSLLVISQLAESWSRDFHIGLDVVSALAERHGEETPNILKRVSEFDSQDNLLWKLEAVHAIETTMCLHLKDFYLRRSPLFLARTDHGLPLLEVIADVFARHLGWDAARRKSEIDGVHKHLAHEMGWKKS